MLLVCEPTILHLFYDVETTSNFLASFGRVISIISDFLFFLGYFTTNLNFGDDALLKVCFDYKI